MGCFFILLCSWEDCPSVGTSSRAEVIDWTWPKLCVSKGLHHQADPSTPGGY